jgi:hypothetical protein
VSFSAGAHLSDQEHVKPNIAHAVEHDGFHGAVLCGGWFATESAPAG